MIHLDEKRIDLAPIFYYDINGDILCHLFRKDSTLYKGLALRKGCKIESQFLSTKFGREKFEWDRLVEIKQILDMGLYNSALTLALMIPDICARIEGDNEDSEKDNGKRYAKWVDDNITKYNLGEHGEGNNKFDCFNGYMCYKLRCNLVHGNAEKIESIPNNKASWFIKNGFKFVGIQFTTASKSTVFKITQPGESMPTTILVLKSISQMVMQILGCGDACYRETSDKSQFYIGYEIVPPDPKVN